MTEDQIPANALTQDEPRAAAWLILDPTDGVLESGTSTVASGFLTRWNQYLDFTSVLWTKYVVGLNSKRQQDEIYEPLVQSVGQTAESIVGRQAWKSRRQSIADSQLAAFFSWYRGHWFSWRGALVAAGLSLAVVGLAWSARRGARAWRARHRGSKSHSRRGEPPVIEFYRRLEAALSGRGLTRHPAQTAYEFALAAGGELAEDLEHRRLAHLPRRVVEAFYRVRFGGRALDNVEADAVEQALVELELALARSR